MARNCSHLACFSWSCRDTIAEDQKDTPASDSVTKCSFVNKIRTTRTSEGKAQADERLSAFAKMESGSALMTRISKLIVVFILDTFARSTRSCYCRSKIV